MKQTKKEKKMVLKADPEAIDAFNEMLDMVAGGMELPINWNNGELEEGDAGEVEFIVESAEEGEIDTEDTID